MSARALVQTLVSQSPLDCPTEHWAHFRVARANVQAAKAKAIMRGGAFRSWNAASASSAILAVSDRHIDVSWELVSGVMQLGSCN